LARKQGALDDQSKFQHCSALWKGVLDVRLLEQALYHRDVDVSTFAIYGTFVTYLLTKFSYVLQALRYSLLCLLREIFDVNVSTNFFEDMQAIYWHVEFEVLTMVVMKWSVFWDISCVVH
jgi:hypothetical protein